MGKVTEDDGLLYEGLPTKDYGTDRMIGEAHMRRIAGLDDDEEPNKVEKEVPDDDLESGESAHEAVKLGWLQEAGHYRALPTALFGLLIMSWAGALDPTS